MLTSFFTSVRRGLQAFREAFLTTSNSVGELIQFTDYEARKVRYDINWASYEGTMFRDIHAWAQQLRKTYNLYTHIRNIYNPSFRLAEFYRTSVWRGIVNMDAEEKGAIPIKLKDNSNTKLRTAVSAVFKNSNIQTLKGLFVLYGTVFGDVGIRVVDDPTRKMVYLDIEQPSKIKSVAADNRDFLKGYELEDSVILEGKLHVYGEKCTRTATGVLFETFLDGKPWAFNGKPSSWTEPYPFVPFLLTKHVDVGLEFGWSEMHAARSKFYELDDMASKTHDQIRKLVDPVWLFNFSKPKTGLSIKSENKPDTGVIIPPAPAGADRPLDRSEVPAMYVNDTQAKAQALVSDLNVADVLTALDRLIRELEAEYPELQIDLWNTTDTASGKALYIAREKVESKLLDRRAAYDMMLIRAIQMAISIGALRGYPGFEGFTADSYANGELDMVIAERPVFPVNQAEQVASKTKVWTVVIEAVSQGMDPMPILKDYGYTEEMIANLGLDNIVKRSEEVAESSNADAEAKSSPPEDKEVATQ